MKFNKKKTLKWLTLTGAALAVSVPTAAMLASCSTASKGFVIASPNDVFANSSTPLGASFIDAPSTTEFQSVYGALVTYVTEGDYKYENKTWVSKPESRLVLEAASKIVIYQKNSSGQDEVIHTIDSANLSDANAFTNHNGTYSINTEEFGKKMANASKVEFTLNKDFKWVDTTGKSQQSLVPRDFLYSLKGYKISSDYKLNSNGYFMGLAGINYDETIKIQENDSTEAGGTFTYVIDDSTKTPYFLDILTKQYFFPIPHSHPDTAATLETPDTSNVVKFTQDGTAQIIDKTKTDWTRVYGGGSEDNVDVWSIGPYYISASSQQDVTFSISQQYFDAMKSSYDMNKLDINAKIPKIIKRYKAGSQEQIYNLFNANQVSYAPVPQHLNTSAVQSYASSPSLIPIPAPKTAQGRFIGYNLGIFNEKGQLKDSKLVTSSYEKFVKNFHDTNALTIRKSLNEYINWGKLAEIRYTTGTKDFSLSSIPYGVYPVAKDANTNIDYYEAIASNVALSIPAGSSIQNPGAVTEQPKGIVGSQYNTMQTSNEFILASNEQKNTLKTALSALGYTSSAPLTLTYWTLLQTKDPKDTAYFTEVGNQIKVLTDGAVTFTYMDYNAASTVDNVYYKKAVPMGDMLWGPDYNGLGTWIGLYFEYDFDSDGNPIDNNSSATEKGYDSLQQSYHVTNLWKPLYAVLEASLESPSAKTSQSKTWAYSLATYLQTKNAAAFGEHDTYKNIKSNLSNEISIWAGLQQSNGIHLLNWIDSQYPILPMYHASLKYQGYKLVDPKYQVIVNQNGDLNYRDFVQNN